MSTLKSPVDSNKFGPVMLSFPIQTGGLTDLRSVYKFKFFSHGDFLNVAGNQTFSLTIAPLQSWINEVSQ